MKHDSSKSTSVEVAGADANNLKNVDVTFPLKQISVVTGVSGSGKSSLLANTLAAEGSRRMRTFLGVSQEEFEQDDVRAFIGPIPPTILVGPAGSPGRFTDSEMRRRFRRIRRQGRPGRTRRLRWYRIA